MPARKQVDSKALLKRIESGVPAAKIMKEFGITSSVSLKGHYLQALMDEGKVPKLASGRSKKETTSNRDAMVTKRGSLIIPKEVISELGFEEGDEFYVRQTAAGISLQRK